LEDESEDERLIVVPALICWCWVLVRKNNWFKEKEEINNRQTDLSSFMAVIVVFINFHYFMILYPASLRNNQQMNVALFSKLCCKIMQNQYLTYCPHTTKTQLQ
jgi:hypothetical protein